MGFLEFSIELSKISQGSSSFAFQGFSSRFSCLMTPVLFGSYNMVLGNVFFSGLLVGKSHSLLLISTCGFIVLATF